MQRGTRRGGAFAAGFAALALVLTACSATPQPTNTSSAGAGSPTTAAAAGGNLVVGVTSDPNTLDPWKATQFQAVAVLQTLYGTLTEFDKDLKVVPGLATSWDVSSDGLTVTFHLRQGVTFADGKALSSADVASSLTKIKDPATAAVSAASLASVTNIAAPDASTVVLTLSAPDAALLANLAVVNMAIVPAGVSEDSLATTPDGTGPFVLKAHTPNQSLTVARNAAYWGDKALLDTVEFRVIPDQSSIVSAMQSGNVQLSVLDDPLVAQTATAAGLSVDKTPQLSYHVLQLNASRSALSNVNVRLAVQCAIDRKQVLDTAALGEGEVTGPITSPAYKSDPSDRPCPTRDVAKAKDYLAKAGQAGGVTLDTIVSTGEYSTSVNEAQNLQSQLAEAGITLKLEVLESGAYVDRWKAGTFDAAVALNGGRPDPDGMYSRYFTSTGNLNKVAGYSSATLDQLFVQGRASSDPAVRLPIYKKIGEELENNAAWVWLFTSYNYTATTKGVAGFVPMANNSMQFLRTTSLS